MHIVMFDVDGTLVDSVGFDSELYAQAVEAELDIAVDRDWSRYEHVSDSGILDELLRPERFTGARTELAARVQQRFVAAVRKHLGASPQSVREIAGARRLVERLAALRDVRVAVATGGWAPTARLKLAHVGIDVDRLAFASSSDAFARVDILRLAAQRALAGAQPAHTTYFGDGVWDRRASERLGYEFIAVGNGVPGCIAYADLDDTEAILARLAGAARKGAPA